MIKNSSKEVLSTVKLKVWDLPVRLFHWLLVALLVGLWWTSQDVMTMNWHMYLGYALLALLLFRVLWGIFGSRSARFTDFVRGPISVFRYVKGLFSGEHRIHLGHNPLGGWSVIALMAALTFQGISGLFANDQIFNRGPFARSVSSSTSDLVTTLHKSNFDLILILVGIHIAAILFYRFVKRDDLVKPMITGRKAVPANADLKEVVFAQLWLAALLASVSAGVVWAVITYLP